MQRTLKFRRRLAWSATIVMLVVLVAWIGSGWYSFGYGYTRGVAVCVEYGRAGLFHSQLPAFRVGWWMKHNSTGDSGLFSLREYVSRDSYTTPLWFPALLATLCSAFFWHRYRRALIASRIGLCPACGYTRAGLDSAALCPECGKAVAVAK